MQWKARCCRESNSASPTPRRGSVQSRTSAAVRVCPSYPSNTHWRQLALYFRRRPEVPVKRTFSIFAGLAFSVGQTANCDRVVVVFPHPAAGGRGCPQVRGHVPHTPCGPSRTAESIKRVVVYPCHPSQTLAFHCIAQILKRTKQVKDQRHLSFGEARRNSNVSDLVPALSF